MKHQNKFVVNATRNPHEFEVLFKEIGGFNDLQSPRLPLRSIVCISHGSLQGLLNAVYDQAWERGREAVLERIKDTLGFDGE